MPQNGVIDLATLGAIDVGGGPPESRQLLTQPKRLALLVYLMHARPRGLRRRDELTARFWPELSDEAARNALSQSLHVLRRVLGDHVLVSRGAHEVGIDPTAVTSDTLRFEAALEGGEFEAAAALYAGPFLPALYVSQATGFEEWLEVERTRLARLYADLLRRLSVAAERAGRWSDAVEWRRRLHDLEPLSGVGAAGLVLALGSAGDRAGALRLAEEHTKLVRDELGANPEPEVLAAVEAVRALQYGNGAALRVPEAAKPGVLAHTRRPRPRWWAVATGVAGVAALASALLAARRRPLVEGLVPNRVLVAAFESRLADSALFGLGELVADRIADGLLRSGIVDVIDPVTSLLAVRDVRVQDTAATSDSGRLISLASIGSAATVVTGTVEQRGDSVLLFARVSDVARGRLVGTAHAVYPATAVATRGVEEVRDMVGGMIAVHLDRDYATVGGAMPPPRLEAYRSFMLGLEPFQKRQYELALTHFLRAAELDTTFTLALVWARYAAGNAGLTLVRDSVASVASRIVRERASGLSPLERYALIRVSTEADSSRVVRDEAIRRAAELAPGSSFSYELGFTVYGQALRMREAIQAYEQVDLRRGWARGWGGILGRLATAYHVDGQFDKELEVVMLADSFGVARGLGPQRRVAALLGLGRASAADMEVERLFDLVPPDTVAVIAAQFAVWEYWQHGYRDRARRLLERLLQLSREYPGKLRTESLGFAAYYARDWERADSLLREAMPVLSGPLRVQSLVYLAVAAESRGRPTEADSLLAVAVEMEEDPGRRHFGRALVAGAKGEADSAVALLRAALTRNTIFNGPLWFYHDPAWDPIRHAKVYREFVNAP